MRTSTLSCGLVLAAMASPAAVAGGQTTPLIPREVLFKNPDRAGAQLSPDGSSLAWLQPDEKGTLQIWKRSLGSPADSRQVTHDARDVRHYLWAYNGDLLFFQDHNGDENYRLFSVSRRDGATKEITAVAGIRGGDFQVFPEQPAKIMVLRGRPHRVTSLFGRSDKALFDPWVVDLESGEMAQADDNPGDAGSWLADKNGVARVRVKAAEGGGSELDVRSSREAPWRRVLKWSTEDIVRPVHLTPDASRLYVVDNLRTDTLRLDLLDLSTGRMKTLASDPTADVFETDVHPVTGRVRAVAFDRGRVRWKGLDNAIADELAAISKVDSGDLDLLGGDQSDRTWLLLFDSDRCPGRYYVWDRARKKATLLFASRSALDAAAFSSTQSVEIPARDGLSLPSYFTLPASNRSERVPMVLYVHGGPWTRDTWGFDGDVQWLANRGYAVLQVNYRGSQGFGKKFRNAGIKEFAGKMHDDLVDAVHWAVKKGSADPKRIAIMGDSYGGYAALVGLTFTPDLFACGVDMFGPSNLVTLVNSFPAYWGPFLASTWYAFVGNPKDPDVRADMEARSPLFKAGVIHVPLLIGQGGNDPRVPQRESEQMVSAVEKAGGAVTYVIYPDEGHGFVRPENRIDFFARVEDFFEKCLGGRAESLGQEKVAGSTAIVRVVGGPRPPPAR